MGTLSQHWTFMERLKWMLFGQSPNRDVTQAAISMLRFEWSEVNLKLIDMNAEQQARLDKIKFLEDGIEQ